MTNCFCQCWSSFLKLKENTIAKIETMDINWTFYVKHLGDWGGGWGASIKSLLGGLEDGWKGLGSKQKKKEKNNTHTHFK